MTKDSEKSRPAPAPTKKTEPRPDQVKELEVNELEERIAPYRI